MTWGSRLDSGAFRGRLIVLVAGGVAAAVLAVALAAVLAFDRAVAPELENRTRLIGAIVRGEVQQAVELGIPLDAIAGLDRHLHDTLQRFDEVERIAVRSMTGEVLAEAARDDLRPAQGRFRPMDALARERTFFVLPVLAGNEQVGDIVVDADARFVQTRLRAVFLDVLVVALVASVIAVELALALVRESVGRPLDRVMTLLREQRQGVFAHVAAVGGLGGLGRATARFSDHALDLAGRLGRHPPSARPALAARAGIRAGEGLRVLRLSDMADIRLALFFFSVGTEIATAFLPIYARNAARPAWMSAELAAALPLLVYLFAVALVSTFAGGLARRIGPRRVFVSVLLPCAVALIGMGVSDTLIGITAWRSVLAVCYALGTVACQEYALGAAADEGRASPIGVTVTAIFGGVFCGSALGGLLAERLGFLSAFATGAGIVLLSALPALLSMRGEAGDRAAEHTRMWPGSSWKPERWHRWRLGVLLFAVAVPANATTAIVVWYLGPLLLADLGSGPAEIARVVMLYYLAVMLVGGAASRLSDRRAGPLPLVAGGALLAAAGVLHIAAYADFWATVAGFACLGIGHAMLRAPMHALALQIGGGGNGVLSLMRLGERAGALVGLLASALLLGRAGVADSVAWVGGTVLCGALVCATVESISRYRSRHAQSS